MPVAQAILDAKWRGVDHDLPLDAFGQIRQRLFTIVPTRSEIGRGEEAS